MHVHNPIVQGQLIAKIIRPITLIVLVLGRVEKIPKKEKIFLKNICSFSYKKVMGSFLFYFYTDLTWNWLYTALYSSNKFTKKFTINSLNIVLKNHTISTVIVSKMRVLGQTN